MRGTLGYVAFLCFVEASVLLPLANLALLSRFHPLLTGLGAKLIWQEPFRARDAVKLLMALCGVALVAAPQANTPPLGSALAVVAACITSGAFLTVKALARRGEPQEHVVASFHLAGAVWPLLSAFHSKPPWAFPTVAEVGWICLAAIGMHGAQACVTMLLSTRGALYAGGASFLVMVWSVLLGVMIGENWPAGHVWAGAALIAGPVLLLDPGGSPAAVAPGQKKAR